MTAIYGFDTETDNDGKTAWIAQWVLYGEKIFTGTSRKALTQRFMKLARAHEKCYIYIHNLKYDLEFFKYCLWDMIEGFGWKIDPVFRNGSPVEIKMEGPKERLLIFRDSMKKWQGNLRSLGDAIGCPKLENIDPEFKPGWSTQLDLDSPDAWTYVTRDAEICYRAAKWWHEEKFTRPTTSGDAWHFAKSLKGKDWWDTRFPPLTSEEDAVLRRGYFGGINISLHQGHHTGTITHEDKISMFPGVMLDKPLPVGKPIDCGSEFPKDSELWVGQLTVKLSLKENHVAWFTFKEGLDYVGEDIEFGEHVIETHQWHVMTLTSVDWANLQMDYNIKILKGGAHFWTFASMTGIFKDYITYWGEKKKKAKKGSAEREHAKRMLNALYGRFALIPDKTTTTLELENGDLAWINHEEKGEPTAYLPYAMFITAWARRELMDRVRKVCDVYGEKSILHCDTDSVIYLGAPIGGYGSELGQWALESQPSEIYEGGFKRYIEVFNDRPGLDHLNVTCAGVPQPKRADSLPYGMWIELLDQPERIAMSLKQELGNSAYSIKSGWLRDLYLNAGKNPDKVNTLKLLPRKVPGGVILEGHTHELDDGLKIRLCMSL